MRGGEVAQPGVAQDQEGGVALGAHGPQEGAGVAAAGEHRRRGHGRRGAAPGPCPHPAAPQQGELAAPGHCEVGRVIWNRGVNLVLDPLLGNNSKSLSAQYT